MAVALPDSIIKQRESRTWKVGICEGERVDPLATAAHVGRHERVLLRRDVINLQDARSEHVSHDRVQSQPKASNASSRGEESKSRQVGVPSGRW
jgi:hypothetical protein